MILWGEDTNIINEDHSFDNLCPYFFKINEEIIYCTF